MRAGDVQDSLARMLAGGRRQTSAQVRTARVESVSGGSASCVLGGDDGALTDVELLGMQCSAGDTVVAVGQSGRWYAIGIRQP